MGTDATGVLLTWLKPLLPSLLRWLHPEPAVVYTVKQLLVPHW